MKKCPAIALIELTEIATGILAADAMIKASPISVLKSGTVHNGKFLILIGGSVASVEEAYRKGLSIGGDQIFDSVLLPDIHPQVYDAMLGKRSPCPDTSLGIIESASVAAVIQAADAAIKRARVTIVELRLADDIGGKGLVLYNGKIEDVEEALAVSRKTAADRNQAVRESLIPHLHAEMIRQLAKSSVFSKNNLETLEGGEL